MLVVLYKGRLTATEPNCLIKRAVVMMVKRCILSPEYPCYYMEVRTVMVLCYDASEFIMFNLSE